MIGRGLCTLFCTSSTTPKFGKWISFLNRGHALNWLAGLFQNFRQLFTYRTTQGPTQKFSSIKSRCGLTYTRSLVLILVWYGIQILIRSSRNRRKMQKNMKNAIFTLLVGVSGNSAHANRCLSIDIFPLLYECKPHKIRNFKFSENLRPK